MSTAKAIALRDITEDCASNGTYNYLLHESDILEYLGIPKPDFRMFNGGHNDKRKGYNQ